MDHIDGSFGRIFYTDKELKLHVKGLIDSRPEPLFSEPKVTTDLGPPIAAFAKVGYCVLSSAVSNETVRNARLYINEHYKSWLKQSKRQDDWRCHLMTDVSGDHGPVEHPAVLDLILQSPTLIRFIQTITKSCIAGIFYSQVAFRTPLLSRKLTGDAQVPDYATGAEYHLDGQANASGTRFPDPWSVLVGIALVDITTEDKGNFTVFPGWHTGRDWSNYPEEKRTKTLPNLGTPTHICLKAGDAVLVHVLLPHRGGKNTVSLHATSTASASSCTEDKCSDPIEGSGSNLPHPWNIPANTREMVFIRVRVAGVPYESPERGPALLRDPMCEFPGAAQVPPANFADVEAESEVVDHCK